MSRILVIGGYGGFGARLCRRLSAAGHHLLVAGRDAGKAARLCATLPDAEPLAMDRTGDVAEALARHRPDLVVDAAGPFQTSSYRVPRACIEAAIPYLDLADARYFVTGISGLDASGRAAGVAIISGASSVPALSGAVARRLARGLDQVDVVDIAISASNRSSAGESVARGILTYVGRPVRLWRGRRWAQAYGWQEMIRKDFALGAGGGLHNRQVAIADVPDHALLPGLLPGRPSVTFRAGTELRFQMRALWLASWLVRWRWLRSLGGIGRWLLALYRLTLGIGGARSAMSVTLMGRASGRALERRWTLVAEEGDGLEIPTLAAALLADDLLAGRIAPGARDGADLLSLDRFEPLLAQLAVRHEISERAMPPPLYAGAMGSAFDRLPPMVRAIHDIRGDAGAMGEGTVVRGPTLAARLIAAAMRFPPSGTVSLHVAFAERNGVERWTRDFGGHRFSSELSAAGGLVTERFGPMRFVFAMPSGLHGLDMQLRRWSCFRIRLPLLLAPRIAAREWEEEGRFRFDVRVSMPLVGTIVHYSGWLKPIAGDRAKPPKERAAPCDAAPATLSAFAV